ncbi:hypothetical protein [Methanoregula sp.]|uniref:hypothetical protein n=1 Tax=Methanoregula sp. TaxID=2052170 RepID=UPI00356A9848
MKKIIGIILAGIVCAMLLAAGCTSSPATTPTTPAVTTTAAQITLAPTSAAAIPANETPSWTGTWNTSYSMAGSADVIEKLVLNQSGSSVTGTYGKSNYPITGSVKEGTITGTWNETDTTGAYSGFFVFRTSADGKSFEGKWVYTADGADALKNTTQYWNGVRA